MIFDASVVRNFALLDQMELLSTVCESDLRIVHGVLGPKGDLSDLGGIRDAFERECLKEAHGSPKYSRYHTATSNLDNLQAGQYHLELLTPSDPATAEAIRLHEADAALRAQLGIRKRRLALNDALTIAVALELQDAVATDDEDAARAYLSLGGVAHFWTLDLLTLAVELNHMNEDVARRGYDMLISETGFWGIPWIDI